MTEARIIPELTDLSAPYWEAARQGRVLLQTCTSCGHVWHPPQPTCPRCRSKAWSWRNATPGGVVDSFTVVRHGAHPAVTDRVPYVIALVRLPDGPLLLCNVVGCADADVHVGMQVEMRIGPTPGGLALTQAWPASRSGQQCVEPG